MPDPVRRLRLSRDHRLLAWFVAAFLLAQGVLYAQGYGLMHLPWAAALALLCWLTAVLTRGGDGAPIARGRAVGAQLTACAVVVVAAGLEGARINDVLPVVRVPLWSDARDAILEARIGGEFANGVANLLLYCVPIGLALLVLAVPPSALGLGGFGRGSGACAAIWLLPPAAVVAAVLAGGSLTPTVAGRILLSNLLNNGVSEEFLWRGAVYGRLRAVMTEQPALFAQAALFGLWHFGTDYAGHGANLLGMLAEMITDQMTLGLAMGYLTLRTGNIAIASAFHVFYDSIGKVL